MANRKDRNKRFYKKVMNALVVTSLVATMGVIPYQAEAAQPTWNYGYAGYAQPFTAPITGSYQFEVWGAQGGNGGAGGYAIGNANLNAGQVIYVYVGGAGQSGYNGSSTLSGGWNGGGTVLQSYPDGNNGSGGGSTDIRTTSDGNWQDYMNTRIIVAGGGGGGVGPMSQVGSGGGATGTSGVFNGSATATGGTQSSGGTGNYNYGSFGMGANGSRAAGGGGYYGGGSAWQGYYGGSAGGGGSGYIGGVQSGSMQNGVQWGNGSAKITQLTVVDTTAPTITSSSIQGYASYQATNANSGSFRLLWGYSDASPQSGYQIVGSRDGWATWGYNSGWINSGNAFHDLNFNAFPEGTWHFSVNVKDSYGNQSGWVGEYHIVIDRTQPGSASFSPNTTSPTNGNVSMTINYPGDASVKQFYIDGGGWQNYGGAVTIMGNTTIHSRSQDAAGNWSVETAYTVNNIDRTPPGSASFSPSVTTLTNGNVGVTINYPGDANVKQFRIDNGGWQTYGGAVTMTGNGTVYSRSQDAAGNWSAESSYAVSNIDKTPPAGATFAANVTAPTNGNVVVSVNYPSDAAVKQVKVDGGAWTNYTAAVTMTGNGTVYGRSQDAAGNWSADSSYAVTNIDKTAPVAATLSASTNAPTNQVVNVTIAYPSDAAVKQYRIDNGAWTNYTAPVAVANNGTVFARSQDAVGNWSVESSNLVSNIDKIAPAVATFTADKMTPTNGTVNVSVAYPSDAVNKEIKVNGGVWQKYTAAVAFTDNGSINARSTDAAGNMSNESSFDVTNIDKIAPNVPTLAANKTVPTNTDLTVTVSFPTDAAQKLVRIGNGAWQAYTAPVVLSANDTVYAKATDEAGNTSAEGSLVVSNIDKIAPNAPTLQANITKPTNGNVLVDVKFPSDASVKEFKVDNGNWQTYSVPVVLSGNATVYARATDDAGNVSIEGTFVVSNIDITPPNNATFKPSSIKSTNQTVSVDVNFPADAAIKQYRIDGGEWQTYTNAFVLDNNGKVEARSQDDAGNWSDVASFDVNNIDKIAPDAPTLVADKTKPTNTDVSVTVAFPSDAAQKMVRIGNGSWQNYTAPLVFDNNDTVTAKAIDEAGNESQSNLTINNIDKIVPDAPSLKADVTKPTNGNVSVDVSFPSDAAVKEYKIDNGNWTKYTVPVVLSGNATVYGRSTDNAGNVSSEGSLVVSNIDITAPDKSTFKASSIKPTNQTVSVEVTFPADAAVKQHRINGGAWQTYSNAVSFDKNGKLEARSQDEAGNWSDVASFDVTNIDKVAPDAPTLKADNTDATNKDVQVSIAFPNDAMTKEYRVDGGVWQSYTNPVTIPLNAKVDARAWDEAGNVSNTGAITISNIDKVLPTVPTAHIDADKLLVEKGADASGIANTLVRINAGEWVEFTAPITLADGKYSVELKSVDTVGNENANTIELYVYDKTLKETLNSLSYVERFPSPPQSKIDEAKAIADRLPDSAPEKQQMLDRIQVLQAKLSKVEVANSVTILQRQVDNGSTTTMEQVGKWKEEVIRLETLVNGMPEGKDKDDQQAALTALKGKLKAIEEATKVNNQLDAIKSSSDLSQLVELVDTLPTGSLKDKLNQTIKASNDLIQAKDQVSQLEQNPTSDSLKAQKDAVAKLPASDAKTALLERIQAVQDQLSAKDALDKATGTFSQKDYDWAVEAINKVDSPDEKQDMLKKLQDIADRVAVVSKVEEGEKSRNQAKIDEARIEANKLPDGKLKDDLLTRLSKIDSAMNTANSILKIAETSVTANNISKTEEAINKLIDSPQKEELKARLEQAKKLFANQEAAKQTNTATDQVKQVEKYKRDPYLTEAYKAVNALPDSPSKTELLKRLDAVVEANRKASEDLEDGNFTPGSDLTAIADTINEPAAKSAMVDATKSIVRAEKFFSRSNIVMAIDRTNRIPEAIKTNPKYTDLYNEMKQRSDALKNIYNEMVADKKLEASVNKATSAVDFFERYPTANYKQKAQDAVSALPAGLIKTSLQNRVGAVQVKP